MSMKVSTRGHFLHYTVRCCAVAFCALAKLFALLFTAVVNFGIHTHTHILVYIIGYAEKYATFWLQIMLSTCYYKGNASHIPLKMIENEISKHRDTPYFRIIKIKNVCQ